jgi:hypothetical protein
MGRVSVRAALLATTALAAFCCSSCGGGKKFYPVHGHVFVNGKPAEGVMIVLHPVDDPDPKPVQPTARVQADGSFELKSFLVDRRVLKDGAPAGKYLVSCIWLPADLSGYGPESAPDRLQGRYSNPKASDLRAEVHEGPTELPPFELKVQPK